MKFNKNGIFYCEKHNLLGNITHFFKKKMYTFCGHDIRDAVSVTKTVKRVFMKVGKNSFMRRCIARHYCISHIYRAT